MATAASKLIVGEPRDGYYPVQSGENVYWVQADSGFCDCPHYTFRCAFHVGDLCKHGQAVRAHIEAQLACPVCRGKGLIVPSGLIRYVDRSGQVDIEPLPCVQCQGKGKR